MKLNTINRENLSNQIQSLSKSEWALVDLQVIENKILKVSLQHSNNYADYADDDDSWGVTLKLWRDYSERMMAVLDAKTESELAEQLLLLVPSNGPHGWKQPTAATLRRWGNI